MGMKESALKLINDAVELNPDSALLHFNRGLLLRALGHNHAARQAQEIAWQLEPAWLEPLLSFTELALEQPLATAQTLSRVDRALRNSTWSDNSRVTFIKGRLAAQRGDLIEAEKLYQIASDQNPKLYLAQQYLANLLLSQERWQEAQKFSEKLLKQEPKRC